jgi:hypothetical protein
VKTKVSLLEDSLLNLLALSLGAAIVPALVSQPEEEDRQSIQGRAWVTGSEPATAESGCF